MTETAPAYGLWSLVLINSALFIFFAFSFFKPQADHAGDVPRPARRVCAPRPTRGTRFRCRLRRRVDTLCSGDPGLLSTLEQQTEPGIAKELTA